MANFRDQDVVRALQLLWRDASFPIELRILAPKGIYSGYFNDAAKLVEVAEHWNERGNIYLTLNQVHPDCAARRLNRVEWSKSGETTKDAEIVHRTNVYIDLDPVRIAGIPSTDDEHQAAKTTALEIQKFFAELGLPESALISSGNGHGLFLAIDLPKDDGQLVKRFLAALATKFDSDTVKVDRNVFNASRIARLPGTMNCKGENLPHRPHRLATIIAAPEQLVAATEQQLQSVIDAVTAKPMQNSVELTRVGYRFDVATWLSSCSVTFQVVEKDGGTQYKLDHCPFKKGDHPAGGCAIFQRHDGSISASCFHSKCRWGWKELRNKIDSHFDAGAEEQIVQGTESAKDPHRLARLILADYAHPDHATIVRHKRTFYIWKDGIWQEKLTDEIRAIITRRVKEEFDRYAAAMAQSGAQCQTPTVSTKVVGDVLNALSSMIAVDVVDDGGWLDGVGWPADEILVCQSAIVHLPSYLAGLTDYAISHTPRLFVRNKLQFDFDPTAPSPTRWLRLLQEIWPDGPDSQQLLQEYFGYCLTPDASLQKFLLLIGASRGGKGTITGVLSAMIGTPNFCSVRLAKLGSRFGLENAVDKSLILVPDAVMPRQERAAEVVELVKAITGGDAIDVDRKGKPVITARLSGKIVITSNNMIALPDDSGALYNRMLVLRFTQSFFGKEDPQLEAKLRAELPGLLLWSIEGYRRLRESNKFTIAKSGDLLKRQLTMNGSPMAMFVGERCLVESEQSVEHQALFSAYKSYCDDGGVAACEPSVFGRKLLEVVPAVDPTHRPGTTGGSGKRPRFYKGIGLKSDATGATPTADCGSESSLGGTTNDPDGIQLATAVAESQQQECSADFVSAA